MLSVKTFNLIRKGLEKRGFEVKVIYLLRDPVERVWSSARMLKRNMSRKDRSSSFNEFQKLIDPLGNPLDSPHSRYENTIINLEKVFNPSSIFLGFYEDLFRSETVNKLQTFLDLPLDPFDFSFIINASPKEHSMPEHINHKMVQHFYATYEFMLDRYGEPVRDLWQGYKVL